jgi:anti-sigma regulatory factor (Ser/Thr protein kinase)
MQENKDFILKLNQIKKVLNADVVFGDNQLTTIIKGIYASDLMSDVLAYGKPESVLLTGLCTNQAAISAYMADFKAVVFLRGKTPPADLLKFAEEKKLVILSTKADMFDACAKIANIYSRLLPEDDILVSTEATDKDISTHKFSIDGKDFANSGFVSSQVKDIIKDIGYDPQVVRRIAIATYEAEMNVVMHALRANVKLIAGDEEIIVIVEDEGKGIPDVDKAMEKGFSTATDDQRAMGFGAGMGLPNIKKHSDQLNIASKVGKGTKIEMRFLVK